MIMFDQPPVIIFDSPPIHCWDKKGKIVKALFKKQMESYKPIQAGSKMIGTKTFFGKEIHEGDRLLYFIEKKKKRKGFNLLGKLMKEEELSTLDKQFKQAKSLGGMIPVLVKRENNNIDWDEEKI